uniref:Uncharacterized protein n=1 Tax=Knipowitschia caucasica TaxID=637954 RepID=A0AAV2MI80_KNICA
MDPANRILQAEETDLITAVRLIQSASSCIEALRSDAEFIKLWDDSGDACEGTPVPPKRLRQTTGALQDYVGKEQVKEREEQVREREEQVKEREEQVKDGEEQVKKEKEQVKEEEEQVKKEKEQVKEGKERCLAMDNIACDVDEVLWPDPAQ